MLKWWCLAVAFERKCGVAIRKTSSGHLRDVNILSSLQPRRRTPNREKKQTRESLVDARAEAGAYAIVGAIVTVTTNQE